MAYVLESTLWISDSRYWIPDSFSRWNLDSGFLRPGFHIPQAKISCFSDSDIQILWIPESEYPHMGDSTYPPSVFSIKRNCSLFLWVPLLSRHSFTTWWFVKKNCRKQYQKQQQTGKIKRRRSLIWQNNPEALLSMLNQRKNKTYNVIFSDPTSLWAHQLTIPKAYQRRRSAI